MTAIFAILIPFILGFFLLALLLRRETEGDLLLRLGMSFPLGMGLITIQMFLMGLLRVPLALPYVAIPPLAEIAVIILALWRMKSPIVPFASRPSSGRRPWPVMALIFILSCWSLAKIASIFVETTLRPIYAWDAWANWSAGAKAFFYSQSLLLDAGPQDFFGKGIVARIIEYPLHNVLSQLWFALWIGGFDDVLVKLGSPLTLLSLALAFYGVAKRTIGTVFGLAMLVLFLSSPLLSYHAIEVYSDLLLGAYLFLALAAFYQVMQGRQGYCSLIGLFSALALFTKDEAPFFALPLILSAVVYILKARGSARERMLPAIIRLILPLLLAAPWFLFKLSYGIGMGAGVIKVVLTFHPEVIVTMAAELLSLGNFFAIPLFLIVLTLFAGRPTRVFLHMVFPLACFVLFFACVYGLTTFYYGHFSSGTVFFRNVLEWYPSICLLMILLVDRILPAEWRSSPLHGERF